MSFANLKNSSKTQFKMLAEKMANESKSYTDNRFWQPDVDKTGNGFAIIRFLPTCENEEAPFVELYNHSFKIGEKWFIENCPTSMGFGNPCPVCEANSILWNTGLEENKNIVRKRKRILKYISNIIVLSDAKHPENEGRVFLFKFGPKIFSKITNAIKPEFEDEKAFDPFNFWEGAPFKLKIRNEENYRNYDKSEFGECGPLFDNDETMETVWKSQHPLSEFLNPKNFKSYDELKTKYQTIMNSKPSIASKEDGGDDEEIDVKPSKPSVTPSSKPAALNKPTKDDDDDFELFRTMLDD